MTLSAFSIFASAGRDVDDLVAFRRERNDFIGLMLRVAAAAQCLECFARLGDIESERVQDVSDRTRTFTIACPYAEQRKQQMLGTNRIVLEDVPRLVLCECEHALRTIVIEGQPSGRVSDWDGRHQC